MTQDKNAKADLEKAISALRNDEPSGEEIEAAGKRVWARVSGAAADAPAIEQVFHQIRGCADVRQLLPAYTAGTLGRERMLLVQDHLRECVGCRRLAQSGSERAVSWAAPLAPRTWGFRPVALAATIVVIIGLAALLASRWYVPGGMRAKVQSLEGTLYRVSATTERPLAVGDELGEGETVRTGNGSHAFLQLRDGSVLEVNQRAELAVNMRWRNTTLNLDQGSVIVQAAKRRSGHLYVVTPDCRVAVTGTVFAVNSGMKGSRVSVIEGEVHVAYSGAEHVLHAGDQDTTTASIEQVPVPEDIAWSENLSKHLALLAQFAKLQKRFEQIPTPGLRYSSALLQRMPANTVVYGAMPNLGDALSEANRIFQEQLQQSAVLREWWTKEHPQKEGPTFEQMVEKIHRLSQYLGDELVLVGLSGQSGEGNFAFVAPVRRSGLREVLQTEFANLGGHGEGGIRVVDEQQLASAVTVDRHLVALVRPDIVMFSPNVRMLQLMNAQLNSGGGFAGTGLGQTVAQAYTRGAGFLLALDLHQMIAQGQNRHAPRENAGLQRSGFADARYLVMEHRDLSGVADNRAVLDFTGQRQGIASWLAAPAPMRSLEFVSPNAGLAFSFLAKSPALMFDDILQMAGGANAGRNLADAEAKLNLNLRDDLLASFGGEITVALDGPVLPKPSWKVIAEVTDSSRLQAAIEKLAAAVNQDAQEHGKPGLEIQQQESQGRIYYTVRPLTPAALSSEVHYTFADGYVIMAPSRALVMNAIATKANGDSLARSGEFRALLPKDGNPYFSGVAYQNLAPQLKALGSALTTDQMQSLQQIVAADPRPTVICAYGEQDRIEIASAGKLLPFDFNSMAFASLLGGRKSGTLHRPHP